MELLKTQTNIDFMGQRKMAMTVSVALLLISLASLATRGLEFGIDFTGGTHADFENGDFSVRRHPRQRQRDTNAVVKTPNACMKPGLW